MTPRETSAREWLEKTIARIPPDLGDAPTEGTFPVGIDYDLENCHEDARSAGAGEASTSGDVVTAATTTLPEDDTYAGPYRLFELYHVPRSQVWQASRGRQCGKVHLHVANGPTRFTAANGRTISRGGGVALCLRSGWYERPVEANDDYERCPRCTDLARRYDVPWRDPCAGAPERDS